MPQTDALIETLKAMLKAERKTYADVAIALNLSEASVKRLFAGRDFTLSRLDAVCRLLGIEISDLVKRMHDSASRLDHLSVAQERQLADDLSLLAIAVCVLNRWNLAQMLDHFAMNEEACVARLLKLDRLGLIELLPGNRIKLRVSPNFHWRDGGPIETFFRETVGREFFDSAFSEEGEQLHVLNGMLSDASAREFSRKMQRLAREFNELNDADAGLPFEKRRGITLVVGLRRWQYGLFQHLLRE